MLILERIGSFFGIVLGIASDPLNLAVLFGSVLLGILFGAMPGLTSTLGVALLTALTYGMDTNLAMVCLLAIYVGGTYGGSYAAILINIPGTAAAAATALDGYPLACKGDGGRAIGLTTTASAIGTTISMLFVVSISPIISYFALQFTSFEFFLLAFFGILISGTLTSPDLVIKGWISGFLGLFLFPGPAWAGICPISTRDLRSGSRNWIAGSRWCRCSSVPSAFPRSSRFSRIASRSAKPRNCSASSPKSAPSSAIYRRLFDRP